MSKRRRRRFTAEEKTRHVVAAIAHGNRSAYAREHGLSYKLLHRWEAEGFDQAAPKLKLPRVVGQWGIYRLVETPTAWTLESSHMNAMGELQWTEAELRPDFLAALGEKLST